jgi:hypothetical protein
LADGAADSFSSTFGFDATATVAPADSSAPPAIHFLIVSSWASGSLPAFAGMCGSSWCVTRR